MTRQIGGIVYSEPKVYEITTDANTHFTDAIVQNALEDEDVTGLEASKIRIIAITIESMQNLDFDVLLYAKDTKTATDLNKDTLAHQEKMDTTTNGFQIAGVGQYYMTLEDLAIPYEDKDASKELHVGIRNRSAAAKNAGSTGAVILKFKYIVVE